MAGRGNAAAAFAGVKGVLAFGDHGSLLKKKRTAGSAVLCFLSFNCIEIGGIVGQLFCG
jgi:hypothetical protein